jgi:hypothetical protein
MEIFSCLEWTFQHNEPISCTEVSMDSDRFESNLDGTEKPEKRRDRRAHPRMHCKGEAQIRFLPDGPKVIGRLCELGLGGCRIDYDPAIPINAKGEVEVRLFVRGFTLRLAGVVVRVDEETGVAFEFTDVSYRKADQIRDLFQELFEENRERWAGAKTIDEIEGGEGWKRPPGVV